MSARKRRLAVSIDARNDIQGTLLFTQQRWGAEQRRVFKAKLYAAMRSLLDYPELGRARDKYFPGCRGLAVEQHVIF